MGLGGTAKKLQKVVDVADELYAKINDLREELSAIRDRIDSTNERVEGIEEELAEQRMILERLADANDVSVDLAIDEETDSTSSEPAATESDGQSSASPPASAEESKR